MRVRVSEPAELAGDYLVEERGEDGSILLHPDTSAEAMLERTGGGRLATPEEFGAEVADMPNDPEGGQS